MQYTSTISFKPGFTNTGVPLSWDRYPMVYLVDGIFVKKGIDYYDIMADSHKSYMLLYEFGGFSLDTLATDSNCVRYI